MKAAKAMVTGNIISLKSPLATTFIAKIDN